MNLPKRIDISKYAKKPKSQMKIENHSVPITPETKARIVKLGSNSGINDALRDFIELFLVSSEPS